ncbi:MAG: hypothetical protein FGM54_03650 [Chitinophagaceae bacterium]|nr:hypothetical protein [Chitinophagaceae bacterium]
MKTSRVDQCPLCGHPDSTFHSYPLANLYSEKMAMVSGESEHDLLRHFKNVICTHCGLIYKQEAYPDNVIQAIFNDVVPDHPKGWDVMSGRFSANNFFHELEEYELAIQLANIEQTNRYRRALLSLIDSIYPHEPNRMLKDNMSRAIEQQDVTLIRNSRSELLAVMKEPMPFKRFSGFSASVFWEYLETKLGHIKQYDEIGCPLWGLLSMAKLKGVDTQFVQRNELNYWRENCKRDGRYCVQWLHEEYNIPLVPFNRHAKNNKRQLLGFFQYLDHLDKQSEFLDAVFNQYESAAVILDGVDEPVYIQHFTGWTLSALNFIAHRYGKKMHTDFDAINESGNRLYLFQSE